MRYIYVNGVKRSESELEYEVALNKVRRVLAEYDRAQRADSKRN